MALHNVRTPDGQILKINAPDDASEEDILGFAQSQYKPMAQQKRTWGEAATDIGGSLISGVGQLAQLPGQLGQLVGMYTPEQADLGLQGIGQDIQKYGEELKSPILKYKEQQRAQKVAQAGEEGGLAGMASEFGTAIKETIKDPALITSFFAEQIPNLAGSWGGGLLAKGGAKLLMRTATEEALAKAGVSGAVGTGAVMQGADVGSDTYKSVYERLKKEQPDMDDAERNGIALSQARQAAIEAALISLGTAALPGGTSIERALVGKGMPGAGGVLKGFLGEAGSEALEEGGGKFVSNLAQQQIFPDVSLTKGVGEAAGLGALGGGLFGGVSGGINARNEAQYQEALAELERQRQMAEEARQAAEVAGQQAQEPLRIGYTSPLGGTPFVFPDGTVATSPEDVINYERSLAEQKYAAQPSDRVPGELDLYTKGEQPGEQHTVSPLGAYISEEQQTQVPPGQLELPLTNEQGQFPLPGIGNAAPANVQEQAPAQEQLLVNRDLTKALGIKGGNKKVLNAIEGKDLTDPAQRAEVHAALSSFAERTTSPGVASNIEAFLTLPMFAEQNEMKLPMRRVSAKQRVANKTAELQKAFAERMQQTQGIPVPVNPLPYQREAANVEPARGNIPTAQPPVERSGSEQGVGVPSVGVGSAAAQTSAAPRAKRTRQRGLGDTTARTEPNIQGAVPTQTPVNAPTEISPQRKEQLNYIAGDLDMQESGAKTKYKKLSPEEKAYVDAKLAEYKNVPKSVREAALGASSDALIAAAQKGNVTYALNEIATGKGFSPLERMLAKRLLANKRYSLPKIEIVPAGSLGKAAAQYNPFTDTVQITEDNIDSHTILHETVHGFVHALISDYEAGRITNNALDDLNTLYQHLLKNNPELAGRYGMESLTEFAAEAMSNPEFQKELFNIPYKKRNVFSEFAKAIMQMLGLRGDTMNALGEAIINVERAMNIGRGYQENVSGTAKAPPVANVIKSKLDEIQSRANPKAPKAKGKAKHVFNNVAENSEREATRIATNIADKFETMTFSFDAGLNNALRRELNKNKKDWDVIKDVLMKISSSQALHSDALAVQFLEHGALKYDPKTYKFVATEDKNNWHNMMNLMSNIAKENGLTYQELKDYANTAFIADRLDGLSRTKQEFYSHLTPEQIKAGKEMFDAIPKLREVQKVWNGIRKNAMDVAIESGLYTKEQADDLLQYMDYVPFYREDQLEHRAGPKEYSNGFIDFAKNFKLKGSEQGVSDVFGNMELWTTYTVSRAVRNRTALNMYNAVKEIMPDQVKDLRQDASIKREDNVISLWENGQRKKVKFADPLFVHAFDGVQSVALPLLNNAAKVSNFLRQSIVLNPLFSLSQVSQDSFAAMMTSGLKNPIMIPFEVMREFIGTLLGGTKTSKILSKYGAVGVRDYSAAIARNELDVSTGRVKPSLGKRLLSPFEKFSMASDNAVRQALYNRTLLETGGKRQADGSIVGGDEAAAIERAFEIINFKRSGASGTVNMAKQLVPFFGAYLQAMNVTAKVLSGRSITPTERAAAYRTLMWNTLMVTALGMLYAAMVGDDDDYLKMDPAIRDKHLIIPGTGFMLPLRNDFSIFPKLIAEYTYLSNTDNGFTDGRKVRNAMWNSIVNATLGPTAVPQFAKPALEVMTNYNFFTDRAIVGKGMEDLPKARQYTDNTSELAKLLGSAGLLSPLQIDHLIKGYLGTVGGLGLMATNAIMEPEGVSKPEKSGQDALRQIPGMTAFFASEHGTALKNDFYELRGEVASAVKAMNSIKQTGTSEEMKEFLESSATPINPFSPQNKDLLKLQGQVNNINNQLTKLRAYEKQLRSLPDTKMSPQQKAEKLQQIRASEDRMLKNVHKLRQMAGY